MRSPKRLIALSVLFVAVATPVGATAGAAGYDLTNPSSTGCVSKGMIEYTKTARTYGAFKIFLRRSTGCNTVWAVVTRTDTKKCMQTGVNCAKINITRTLGNGTKTTTGWRKMPDGAKAVLSLQLIGTSNSSFRAKASTFGGTLIGSSGTLSVSSTGVWTSR